MNRDGYLTLVFTDEGKDTLKNMKNYRVKSKTF